MKKSEKKNVLKVLVLLLGLYFTSIVVVPYLTLSATAGTVLTSIYDHFVTMKDNVTGDTLFYALVFAILAVLYTFLVYRPKKAKTKEAKTAKKLVFGLAVVYAALLIILPYITLPVDAAAYLVNVFEHFQSVKDAIASDFSFLALAFGMLSSIYYFGVYRPKL